MKTRAIFTLKGKMSIGFLCVVLCMFAMISYSCYQVLAPKMVETQLDMQTRYAQILCGIILNWKTEMEQISVEIATDEMVQGFLRLDNDARTENKDYVQDHLAQLLNENEGWKDIWLVDKSMNIMGSGDAKSIRPYLMDRLSTVSRYGGDSTWDSGYDTTSMILARAVNDIRYNPNDCIGYLFISIENDEIATMFEQYRLYEGQRFSLKGLTDGFEVTEQGFFYNYYDNYANLIHVEIIMNTWYLRTWSDQSVALMVPNSIIKRMLTITVFTCAFAYVLCIFIAQLVTKPIKQLKDTFRHYGMGDFSAKVEIQGNDEIAELGIIVNDMSDRISELFDLVRAKENSRRRLELQTLIYQINPHFLYNTLDSVNAIARAHKDEEVAQIVTDLSRLFRLGLHSGEEFVSVRDEIMHAMYYLRIQKMRFSDQLSWRIQVDNELLDLKICKFILQPIVENAIIHGVKSRDDGCEIVLSAYRSGDELCFAVEDFGLGMTEQELELIRLRISGDMLPEGGGFGLWNVNQRIRMYYGRGYGIRIFSTRGEGTKVVLNLRSRMPVRSDLA